MFHSFDIVLDIFLYLIWVDEKDGKNIFKGNCFVRLLVEVSILLAHGASNFFFS